MSATFIPEPLPPAPRWLWPVRLQPSIGAITLRWSLNLGSRLGPWYRWLAVGAVVGAAPFLVIGLVGWETVGLLTALSLTPLLAAAAVRDRPVLGLGTIGVAFVVHNAIAITLAAHDPASIASLFPRGQDYWHQTRDWLVTGVSREYDVGYWLPAHAQMALVMTAFTYLSLGFITLWHGFYEVDLMNCYVGHLLNESGDSGVVLLLGWHPWSICRGIGFLFLTYAVVAFSLERLTGSRFSTGGRRLRHCILGIFFLVLDAALKYLLLEDVRTLLVANLL
jgi:hypothetical protein